MFGLEVVDPYYDVDGVFGTIDESEQVDESMVHRREVLDRRLDARFLEALAVVDTLVAERVETRDDDRRWREPRDVPREDRREVGIAVIEFVAGVLTCESASTRIVGLAVLFVAFVVESCRGVHPGIDEYLPVDFRPVAFARENRDHRREVAARAVAGHDEPVGIAAEITTERLGPLRGGVGVVDGRRERVLGASR